MQVWENFCLDGVCRKKFRFAAFIAALTAATASAATTAGWENIAAERQEVEPAKVLWRAPLDNPSAFTVEKRDGAEGSVVFGDGTLTVEKTNARGIIVITAPSFSCATNQPLRFMADVHCSRGSYFYSQAMLRAYEAPTESLSPYWELETRHFSMGGAEEMKGCVNQAPGMFNRKFFHLRMVKGDGAAVPVIVVGGEPSKTVWKNWLADDLDAADMKWKGYCEARTARDRSAERIAEAEFDRLVAADVEHTAEVKKVDGIARLVVDGKVAYPVAYRAKGAFGKDILLETFAAGAVCREGVDIVVKGIAMGGSPSAAGGWARHYWTPTGFDAVAAVRDIRDSLRIAPKALVLLSVDCNAYPDFVEKEHPDEAWIKSDGSTVVGTSGSCTRMKNMGVVDRNRRWAWPSYASPAWRGAVRKNLVLLIRELKKQGLSKRIVGLHLSGYHDGQFHSPFEDHSKWAKAEYADYLRNDPLAVTNFAAFSKILGFRAQEDFARTFKRELGKKAVAVRWNMSPFTGIPDITPFAFSDAIDIIVPQPTYETRRPGMVSEMKLPYSSFNLHDKLYFNEFDLRTYAALETWAESGVVATKGLGQLDDLTMWRTAYRKLAGMMFAHSEGYWFYDMGGGWYSAPEIARDIGEALAVGRKILARSPRPWRPDVAVVADEEQLGGGSETAYAILRHQLKLFAASGVPFEFYLGEDVFRDPSLLAKMKMVVLAFTSRIDERRAAFLRTIAADGRTVVYLAETARDGGAEVIGFPVKYGRKSRDRTLAPESGVAADEALSALNGIHKYHWPTEVDRTKSCTWLDESPDLKVIARYADDRAIAIASRDFGTHRGVYVAEPAGLSPALFNRLSRESGAYVPVDRAGLQVDMNGDFVSCHATRTDRWTMTLPFAVTVVNLKSGCAETVTDGKMTLDLTAGETCWFRLDEPQRKEKD